jgi:hypothetical protein
MYHDNWEILHWGNRQSIAKLVTCVCKIQSDSNQVSEVKLNFCDFIVLNDKVEK